MSPGARSLKRFPLHLGPGGSALPQPEMTGPEWFEAYGVRTAGDGANGRLVSLFEFDMPWDSWEMHPVGEEVVLCLEGEMTLHQQFADGSESTVALGAGDYAVNSAGCWHTADCAGPVRALFITAGEGTTHCPR